MYNWSPKISAVSIIFSISTITIAYAFFSDLMENIVWTISQLCIILIFFLSVPLLFNLLKNKSHGSVVFSLFFISILLKSIYFIFLLFTIFAPHINLFENNFKMSLLYPDAQTYHQAAHLFAQNLSNYKIYLPMHYLRSYSYSDYGYPVFLGFVYFLLKPTVISAIVANIVFASLSVVLIYKITYCLFNCRNSAFLAASISIFFPYFNYYIGFPLKETLLIFLVLIFFYYIVQLMVSLNNAIIHILIVLGIIYLLFYFRTFLSILAFLCFLSAIYLTYNKKLNYPTRLFLIFCIGVASLFVIFFPSAKFEKDIVSTFKGRHTAIEGQVYQVNKQLKLKTTKNEFLPLTVIASLVAPFPSFVKIKNRDLTNVQFANALVKNIMVYFAYIGIIFSFRQKNKYVLPFVLFFIGYTFSLAISGNILQQRFQMISLPILVIFMSFGIVNSSAKHLKLWIVYLHGLSFIILGWNYYKLYIRGII